MSDEVGDMETAEDMGTAPPRARGRGGKRTGGRGGHTTVVTRQTFVEGGEDKEEPVPTFAALFAPGPDDVNDEIVVKVRVTRTNPDEGMLGYIVDMNASEDSIKEQWGGSTYRLDGLNIRSKIVRVHTLKIAGEPIFASHSAGVAWRRARGLPDIAQPGAAGTPSIQEMMELMDKREEKRRLDQKEADDRRREDERLADERRRAAERESRMELEKMRIDAEERRKRDDEERDRRRKQDDEDRDRRRAADAERAMGQQQQFMAQMLGVVQQSSAQAIAFAKELSAAQKPSESGNPVMEGLKMIAAIKDSGLMGDGGSGGEEDLSPMGMLAKVAPQLMESLVGGIREIRSPAGTVAAPPSNPSALAQLPPVLADKVANLATKVAAKGQDPAKFLETAVDQLTAAVDNPQEALKRAATGNPQSVNSQAPVSGTLEKLPVRTQSVDTTPAPVSTETPAPGRATRLSFGA